MQILVKVETGFNCNWRNIEPLQPEGFKGQTANEKETLKNSIVKNGFHDAFDVWQHDNKLLSIDGVHRKIALLELAEEGYEVPEQLPCTYVTAENETEAATIILSRNSQHSHIIRAAVLMEACAIPAKMIEAVVPQKNLEAWSESDNSITEQLTAEEDDFEFEDGGIETDIVIGDLFEIGEHRLLCGDSTQTDTFEKLMQGELADMVVTDPPYNVNYEGSNGLKIENDNMSNNDFYQFLYDFYTALSTVVKKGGVVYVWHASSEVINFAKAFVDAGFLLKQQLIWLKNQLVMGRQDYQWKHEPCLEGVNDETWEMVKEHEPCLYGWKAGAGHYWKGGRKQTTILEFDKPRRNGEHPTMKPVGLFGIQIENSSKVGDIVIDAFGGSGTAMVACEQLKRKARVIEFDPKYCQVIVDRMRKLDPTLIIKRNGVIYE